MKEETKQKISKINIKNIFTKRPICSIEGCSNLVHKAGKRFDGTWNYKKLCGSHHRKKYGMKTTGGREGIDNKVPCRICGWNKAPCDRHRIEYRGGKKGYTKGNVIILCPNCHRLVHLGLLKLR